MISIVPGNPISMGDINVELGRIRTSQISLDGAENGSYGAINQNSASKPSGTNPAAISEWYNYNHSATAPSITITSYSAGYLYFTLSGTGYSTSALTVRKSTTSSSGPWSNDTNSSISPRNVGIPTVTTWYQIQDAITPSILSNVYQYVNTDTTPPPAPILMGTFNNAQRALTLSWNNVTDISSPVTYKIYSSNAQVSTAITNTATFYGAWILTGNNSWTVRSVDAAGNTSGNSNAYTFVAS